MPKQVKIVKVRIRRGGLHEDLMVYPDRYNAEEVDRYGVGPLNVQQMAGAYSGHIGMGGDEEWCLIVLLTSLAQEYAESPDMEIITAPEADALMEEWRIYLGEPEEVILDPGRIAAIRAKQGADIPLTQEDLDALDPEHPARGINKRLRPIKEMVERGGHQEIRDAEQI